MTIHLKYGGSTAQRTLACPAWVNLKNLAPDIDRTSDAAERGSMLHEVMEAIYTSDDPHEAAGSASRNLTPADRDAVEYAFNITERLLEDFHVDEYVTEQMLILQDDIGGSADMIACGPEHVLIIDYKFGYQPVTDPSQFLLYAIAGQVTPEVQDMFTGRKVLAAVVQPAVSEANAHVMEFTSDQLQTFRNDFLRAVKLAEAGADHGNPGEHCKYCPAAAYCPAKRAQVHNFLKLNPLVSAQLADGMTMVGEMKEQIKAIEAEVFSALENGLPVPGWKLVLKRAARYWKDEAAAWQALRNAKKIHKEMYVDEMLKSPPQVETAMKKAKLDWKTFLEPLVDTRSTGTTIAPESDKRPAVERGVVPDAISDIISGK